MTTKCKMEGSNDKKMFVTQVPYNSKKSISRKNPNNTLSDLQIELKVSLIVAFASTRPKKLSYCIRPYKIIIVNAVLYGIITSEHQLKALQQSMRKRVTFRTHVCNKRHRTDSNYYIIKTMHEQHINLPQSNKMQHIFDFTTKRIQLKINFTVYLPSMYNKRFK